MKFDTDAVSGQKGTFCKGLIVYASVAQLVELLICNQWVGGSSPSAGFTSNSGKFLFCLYENDKVGFPSGQREQTVNLSAKPSEVQILPPPPPQSKSYVGDFGLISGSTMNYMASCVTLTAFCVFEET